MSSAARQRGTAAVSGCQNAVLTEGEKEKITLDYSSVCYADSSPDRGEVLDTLTPYENSYGVRCIGYQLYFTFPVF